MAVEKKHPIPLSIKRKSELQDEEPVLEGLGLLVSDQKLCTGHTSRRLHSGIIIDGLLTYRKQQ